MNYWEMIGLPHYELRYHPRMSMEKRAFQFAPFSALVGYEEAILEKNQIYDEKVELFEEEKERINAQLLTIKQEKISCFTCVYFSSFPQGGKYQMYTGFLKSMDWSSKRLIFEDGLSISFEDIYKIYL